jgi:hypothetical protein
MNLLKHFTFIILSNVVITRLHAQTPIRAMNGKSTRRLEGELYDVDGSHTAVNELGARKVHNETIMNGLFLVSHYTGMVMGMNYRRIEYDRPA